MRKFYALLFIFFVLGVVAVESYRQSTDKKALKKYNESKQTSESSMSAGKNKLSNLLKNGQTVKCSFSQQIPGALVFGNLYTNGNSISAEVNAPNTDNTNVLSHMLITNNSMYLWYDEQKSGMVTHLDSAPSNAPVADVDFKNLDGIASLLDEFDYKCDAWAAEDSFFQVPPEVTFIDKDQFVLELNKQLCKKCDAETEIASRLLCKKTLKCTQ